MSKNKQNIDKSAVLKNSTLSDEIIIYRDSKIINSILGYKNSIGDFSRLTESECNEYVKVDRNNLIYHSFIGGYTYTGQRTTIMRARIGKFCSISWNVTIGPGEHDYNMISSHDFLYNNFYDIKPREEIGYNRFKKNITIGNDVWIGANVVVLRGVVIGDGAVIGANTIVTKDVPPYAIITGNPGRILKYRFEKDIIEKLLLLKWWDLPRDKLKKAFTLFNSLDISNSIDKISKL